MLRLLPLLVVLGCHHAAPGEAELLRDGENEARRLFALAEGRDCAQLEPLLVHPESCKGIVNQLAETHSHLTQIQAVKIDGRDPHVVLVTVNVQSDKQVHTWVVRAKWTADGWRMSL